MAYRGNSPRGDGVVRYAIFRDDAGNVQVVFSGVTKEARSTINAAEEVIAGILNHDELPLERIRFFDLQTQAGYHRSSYCKPDEFQYDEVTFRIARGEIRDVQWRPLAAPNFVIEVFKDLIGPNPRQSNLWAAG